MVITNSVVMDYAVFPFVMGFGAYAVGFMFLKAAEIYFLRELEGDK